MLRRFGQTFSLHLRGNTRPKDEDTFLRITFHCSIHLIVSSNCVLTSFSSLILNFPDKQNYRPHNFTVSFYFSLFMLSPQNPTYLFFF